MPIGDSVVLNGYTITLIGINNTDCPDTQTWTYSVIKTGTHAKEISFWVIGMEHEPPFAIVDTDPEAEFTDLVCLDTYPPDRPVVKWNIINGEEFHSGTFSFTIKGCLGEQQRDVALQAGERYFFGMITGPCCCPEKHTTCRTTTTYTTCRPTTTYTTCRPTTTYTTSRTTSTTTSTTTRTTSTTTRTTSTSTTFTTTKAPSRGIKIF